MFLNPIWLFAIAAVVIPVAIHLWNIRPGKVLKVGSVSLIDAASRKSSRSLKLLDIPLFIVRCLLLIVLALLLAVPLWQKKLLTNKVKGWVLIPKETLQIAYTKFRPVIDSLTNAGYEFHYFDPGFPKSDLKQILLHPNDSILIAKMQPANYWNIARQLDTVAASTLPVYIFTPNQAQYFKGEKPTVALNLHWQTYIPADSTSTWIQTAHFNKDNTIRVTQGNSKPSETSYSYANIKTGDQPNSPYVISVGNGVTSVSLKSDGQQSVTLDTTTMLIAVYADNNTIDAEYLTAALQSVSQFTQRKTILRRYSDPSLIPSNQTWLFWLSDKPVNDKLLQQCHNILRYEKGKVVNSDSWINNNGAFSVALQQDHRLSLFKLIEANPADNTSIWRDGFGHPILTLQKQGKANLYNFYSHFNPAWNDLVWSNEFPAWIMKLMAEDKQIPAQYDKRILAQQQFMPDISSQAHSTVIKTTGFVNLANYCWLLLALLFAAERWMAHKSQTVTNNG